MPPAGWVPSDEPLPPPVHEHTPVADGGTAGDSSPALDTRTRDAPAAAGEPPALLPEPAAHPSLLHRMRDHWRGSDDGSEQSTGAAEGASADVAVPAPVEHDGAADNRDRPTAEDIASPSPERRGGLLGVLGFTKPVEDQPVEPPAAAKEGPSTAGVSPSMADVADAPAEQPPRGLLGLFRGRGDDREDRQSVSSSSSSSEDGAPAKERRTGLLSLLLRKDDDAGGDAGLSTEAPPVDEAADKQLGSEDAEQQVGATETRTGMSTPAATETRTGMSTPAATVADGGPAPAPAPAAADDDEGSHRVRDLLSLFRRDGDTGTSCRRPAAALWRQRRPLPRPRPPLRLAATR
eukprot:TRINITY_DN2514_c0_g1_i3.p1 TRINITY_DN2514_c0_g1~~TRINITY_DN2514_c0_g1_i3.p1  ORF type:complete len:410 (+),score=89.91 TRINITY_DN2514_c0_g1_i3:186-1232(+)